jgi:dTDP-glucose 4,6-dehydratase
MLTYLVTGGAGFIGSNYIRHVLRNTEDVRVINVDALTYAGNLENLRGLEGMPRYAFVRADICDADALGGIFCRNDVDVVVHFAAESHVDRSIEEPDVFVRTNVLGTLNLLNAALGAWESEGMEGKKFVHVSTDEVYGSLGPAGYFTEKTPLDPHSPYSASKAASDLLVKAYGDTYGLPVNITRCSNNYGPYQFPEKLIPLMLNNALCNRPLPVYGEGLNVRDWLYVGDHCAAVELVARKGKPGEVYNIGGHNEKTNIEIVRLILAALKEMLLQSDPRRAHITEDLITFVKDRKGHDLRYAIDPSKIRRELGWEPKTAFEEGLRGTIAWYLDNEDWLRHVTSGEYTRYYERMYGGR